MTRQRRRRGNRGARGGYSQKELKKVAQNLDQSGKAVRGRSKATKATANISKGTAQSGYKKYTRWCEHWQKEVDLLDGLVVHASAWSDRPNAWGGKDLDLLPTVTPDIGFYLDDYWADDRLVTSPGFAPPFLSPQPQGGTIIYPWMDLTAPNDMGEIERACLWLLAELEAGKFVDIGCIGGHGRTGTLISCLLVMQGMDPNMAISKIRQEYCSQAVESIAQTRFIQELAKATNPAMANIVPSPYPTSNNTGSGYAQKASDYWKDKDSGYTGPKDTAVVRPSTHSGSFDDEDGWRPDGVEWWPDEVAWDKTGFEEESRYSTGSHDPYDFSHQVDDIIDEYQGPDDDQADYDLWLKLNAEGIEQHETEKRLERTARQTILDDYCALAPCIMPDECEPDEGDCFVARCHNREFDPQTKTFWNMEEGDAR